MFGDAHPAEVVEEQANAHLGEDEQDSRGGHTDARHGVGESEIKNDTEKPSEQIRSRQLPEILEVGADAKQDEHRRNGGAAEMDDEAAANRADTLAHEAGHRALQADGDAADQANDDHVEDAKKVVHALKFKSSIDDLDKVKIRACITPQ